MSGALLSSGALGSATFRAGAIARVGGWLADDAPIRALVGTPRNEGQLRGLGQISALLRQPATVSADLEQDPRPQGMIGSFGSGWIDAFTDAGLYDDRIFPVRNGYSYEVDGALARTPMQSGRIRQRQQWRTWRHVITARFELSLEQYQVAEDFLESTNYGWFGLPVVTAENDGLLQVETVRIIDDLQASLEDDGESVVLNMKLELFREEDAYAREEKYAWSFNDGLGDWTGVGTYGTLGADGQVTLAPVTGTTAYAYASTDEGVEGLGLSGVGGLGAPSTGSALYSPLFTVNVGDVLTCYLQLVTSDGGQNTDYGFVRLLDGEDVEVDLLLTLRSAASGSITPGYAMPVRRIGTLVTTPANVLLSYGTPTWAPLGDSSGTCRQFGCGRTGWVKVEYVFKSTGTFKLEIGVVNWSVIGSDLPGSEDFTWVGTDPYTAPDADACDFSWASDVLDTGYQTGLAIDGVSIRG